MGILPFVIRQGRDKYAQWSRDKSSVHPSMESHSESTRLLAGDRHRRSSAANTHDGSEDNADNDDNDDDSEADRPLDGSERFDLYFGAASFCIDAMALTAVGVSKEVWQLYACTQKIPSMIFLA